MRTAPPNHCHTNTIINNNNVIHYTQAAMTLTLTASVTKHLSTSITVDEDDDQYEAVQPR